MKGFTSDLLPNQNLKSNLLLITPYHSVLKPLEALYFNPDHIEVKFEGTYEPSITWFIDGAEYKKDTDTQFTPGVTSAWANNAVTFKLSITMSKFPFGKQPFTVSAKLKFGDKPTEELVTQDAKVYRRGKVFITNLLSIYGWSHSKFLIKPKLDYCKASS
jgi:hypothetical protein